MRANRLTRALLRTAMGLATAGLAGCGASFEPGESSPVPDLTAGDVSFAPVGKATMLMRAGASWLMVDGAAKTVTYLELNAGHAVLSPDGASIAYTRLVATSPPRYGIFVARRDGSARVRISGVSMPQYHKLAWSPDGAWVYFTQGATGSLYRVRRSGGSAQLVAAYSSGTPRTCPMIWGDEPISVNASGEVVFACLSSGIYVAGAQGTRLVIGSATPTVQRFGSPVWSPDGARIAFQGGDMSSIRIVDAATGIVQTTIQTPIMYVEESGSHRLCWLRDANTLAFVEYGAGSPLYVVGATGGTAVQVARLSGSNLSCSG